MLLFAMSFDSFMRAALLVGFSAFAAFKARDFSLGRFKSREREFLRTVNPSEFWFETAQTAVGLVFVFALLMAGYSRAVLSFVIAWYAGVAVVRGLRTGEAGWLGVRYTRDEPRAYWNTLAATVAVALLFCASFVYRILRHS